MIDITQIRVGNIVYDNLNKRNVSINGIETGHNTVWVDYNNGYGIYPLYIFQIDEIKLTEKILLDVGFSKHKTVLGSYEKKGFRFHTQCPPPHSEDKFTAVTEEYLYERRLLIKGVDYLHELQNLYFCLTRDELQFVS